MEISTAALAEAIGIEPLNGIYDKSVSGVFISDMVSDVMNGAQPGAVWVTVQTHKNIVAAANLVDVSAIIVTRGKSVPKETLDIADRVEISVFSADLETFDTAVKLFDAGLGADR